MNVLSNALKFTNREGKIQINVEYVPFNPDMNHGKYVRISVTDNGLGIKKQDQDKLFKLFGSIKDKKNKINTKGIGLGLVISRLIVSKFNGYMDFVS